MLELASEQGLPEVSPTPCVSGESSENVLRMYQENSEKWEGGGKEEGRRVAGEGTRVSPKYFTIVSVVPVITIFFWFSFGMTRVSI